MKDKIGEKHAGVITSKTDFGIFVRLKLHHVEGLIHISTLKAGQLERFKVGEPIKIEVTHVNINRRFVDFTWIPTK
jgi:ribonuclease R